MAKKHVMTPARRAALKKAQAASARKRSRGGVTVKAKRSSPVSSKHAFHGQKKTGPSTKRRVAGVALGVGAYYGAAVAATVIASNYEISKTGMYNGKKYRQQGPHFMQFYGKGMSADKAAKGFERHWNAHATPEMKAERHLVEMGYGNYGSNRVTVQRMKPIPGQKALPPGKSSKRGRWPFR